MFLFVILLSTLSMVTDIKQDNIIIIIGVLIGIIKPSIIPGINEYEVLIYFFYINVIFT